MHPGAAVGVDGPSSKRMIDARIHTPTIGRSHRNAFGSKPAVDRVSKGFPLSQDIAPRMVEQRAERFGWLVDRRSHREHPAPALGSPDIVTTPLMQFRHAHERHEMPLVDRERTFERRGLAGIVATITLCTREVQPEFGRDRVGRDRPLKQTNRLVGCPCVQAVQA